MRSHARFLRIWLLLLASCPLLPTVSRAEWVGFQKHQDIVYLLFASPVRIERYDLENRTWLPEINLPGTATAFLVEDSGLYVAFGGTARKYTLAGTDGQDLANVSGPIARILAWNDNIYLSHPAYPYGNFLSLNKNTGAPVDSIQLIYDAYVGASLSTSQGRIYGRDEGISPEDIQMLTLNSNGTFGDSVDSPYHGTYPSATNTYVFPDGNLVGDDSGTVYSATNLTFFASFGGTVEAIAFDGANPVILRDRRLVAFSEQFLESGIHDLSVSTPRNLATFSSDVFVFHTSAEPRGADVVIVPLEMLQAEPPAPVVDPNGLTYTPDQVLVDRDGTLFLYSKSHANVFRWSSTTRSYSDSLPLVRSPDAPSHMAYSADTHRLYLAYPSGRIDQIRLSETDLQQPFAVSPQEPLGLVTAGEFLFVCDRAGPWATHYIYHPDGSRLDSRDWNYFSRGYTWNAGTRRLYFFRDEFSPNDLHFEEVTVDGLLGDAGESPYHGEVATDLPIRVHPDGGFILLGSSQIFTAPSLNLHPIMLPDAISDAFWTADRLFTIREINGGTRVQSWQTNDFAQLETVDLSGNPLRLLPLNDEMAVVTRHLDTPRFHLLNQDLEVQFASPAPPGAPGGLTATNITSESLELIWSDHSDNEDAFLVQGVASGTGNWVLLATVPANTTHHVINGLTPLTDYDLRVLATNSLGASSPAGPISVRTLPDPRSPLGPPFELTSWRVLATSVELRWRDNATNELGFKLERKRPADPDWTLILTSDPDVTAHVDAAVAASTTYQYRIRAFNSFSDSELSPELTLTTLASDSQPPSGRPGGLHLISATAWQVTIGWTDLSVNEDGFIVERAEGGSGAFAEVGRPEINATTYQDSAVEPGRTYHYRVRSYNAYGESSSSITLAVTTASLGGTYLNMADRMGDITYFAFEGPNRLERYDLQDGQWLDSLPLPEKPTALLVHPDGIYIGFGRRVSRFNHDLTGETHVVSLSSDVRILAAAMDYLYARATGGNLFVVNRTTGQLIEEAGGGSYGWQPKVAVGETIRKLFARSASISPSDILSVELQEDGTRGAIIDSPYHGSYPGAAAVWIFPNESRVVDSAGILYNTSNLSYAGSLAGPVDDVVFHGVDVPIILRGNELIAYSNLQHETGRRSLSFPAKRLFLEGTSLIAFGTSATNDHGLVVETVPLSSLNPIEPGEAPPLYGLDFAPDDLFLDANNVLYLFSQTHRTLFRWDVNTREYLEGIALTGAPEFVAYSAENHTVYLAYDSGKLTKIDLNAGSVETPFINLPERPCGLATAGEYVFTCDPSGAWVTHSLFAPDGMLIESRDWSYHSQEYVWNPAQRRMYFFRDDTSPNDLLYSPITAGGAFGTTEDSPYHGDYSFVHPIRVRPDGAAVVIGSGHVFDGASLTHTHALPNTFTDAAWLGSTLHTLRGIGGLSQIQKWSANYTSLENVQFSGDPIRLLPQSTGFLLVTSEHEQPRMTLLDEALAAAHQTPINRAPTAITATPLSFPENATVGTVLATLLATDPDPADTHTFVFTGGDTNLVRLDDPELILIKTADYEIQQTVSVAVRATDPYGKSAVENIVLSVTDVNEPPVDIHLSNTSVTDNLPVDSVVATLSAVDPDAGDTLSFTLEESAGTHFRIQGSELVLNAPLNALEASSHDVIIRATDAGGLWLDRPFTIQVARYIPPPPLGEVTLEFNVTSNFTALRWEESGFVVTAHSGDISLASADHPSPIPHGGTGHLRQSDPSKPLALAHLTEQSFQLFSVRLAELTPAGKPASVIITGRRTNGSEVMFHAILDGAADGPDGIPDFQTVHLPDDFHDLEEVTFNGKSFALDDVAVFVGSEPPTSLVRVIGLDLNAYENPTGVPDAPPYPHTAWVGVTRVGNVDQPLTCQLSLAGTALHAFDFFIDSLNSDRTVNFQPGQRTVWLELYPLPDSVAEGSETVVLSLEPGSYTRSIERQAIVVIREGLFAGWLAKRWGGLPSDAPELRPEADPDGNGMSNLAEWVVGMEPHRPDLLPVPRASVDSDQLVILFQKSRLAADWEFVVESSPDLEDWQTLTLPLEELPGSSTVQHFKLVVPMSEPDFYYRTSVAD